MPSPQALWYAGAAAAATAVAGGVVLIVREVKKSKTIAPPGLEGGVVLPHPPRPPTPTPRPDIDLGFGSAGDELRAEICRRWKAQNARPQWRPQLMTIVRDALLQQIAEQDTSWSTIGELRQRAFSVSKEALASLCPEVPLPGTILDVDELREMSVYWDELWEIFYSRAYALLSGSSSGPQPS